MHYGISAQWIVHKALEQSTCFEASMPVNNALKRHMGPSDETLKTDAPCHELSVGNGT